jgi:hypothetical protein
VRFPNSMVDRITPMTTDEDRTQIKERFRVEDAWPVVSEPFTQWALEDDFSAGRPLFEDVGVQVVPDVVPYELMKLRLLNGGVLGGRCRTGRSATRRTAVSSHRRTRCHRCESAPRSGPGRPEHQSRR